MKTLTHKQLKKIKSFRDILDEVNEEMRETFFGKIHAAMAEVDNKKELMLQSIEMYLRLTPKEFKEVFKRDYT